MAIDQWTNVYIFMGYAWNIDSVLVEKFCFLGTVCYPFSFYFYYSSYYLKETKKDIANHISLLKFFTTFWVLKPPNICRRSFVVVQYEKLGTKYITKTSGMKVPICCSIQRLNWNIFCPLPGLNHQPLTWQFALLTTWPSSYIKIYKVRLFIPVSCYI